MPDRHREIKKAASKVSRPPTRSCLKSLFRPQRTLSFSRVRKNILLIHNTLRTWRIAFAVLAGNGF